MEIPNLQNVVEEEEKSSMLIPNRINPMDRNRQMRNDPSSGLMNRVNRNHKQESQQNHSKASNKLSLGDADEQIPRSHDMNDRIPAS